MKRDLSRRGFLAQLGTGVAGLSVTNRVLGDPIHAGSKVLQAPPIYRSGETAFIEEGKVIVPRREIAVMRDTDVLVVGGGAAGVMAALGAARTGAKVTIVERYGCFGGLWTAGQVLIVLATHVRDKNGLTKCVRGIPDELLERLTKVRNGIVNQAPGKRNPTSDPEATKYMMAEMLRESGVDILLHSWVTNAIMDGDEIKGAIFESKSGCKALKAKVVIDTTGDGDVFGAAGAAHTRHVHRIGLVHRRGGVTNKGRRMGNITPINTVKWKNMSGPVGDALDVETLTRCDLDGRRAIWNQIKSIQEKDPNVFILDTASQLGVRATRTLKGMHEINFAEASTNKVFKDVVGVGGENAVLKGHACQIPYRALVPEKLDNLLAAGRCIAADNTMLNWTRLIGPALVSGQAAGAAAGLATNARCRVRDVNIEKLQTLLKKQGAYLG